MMHEYSFNVGDLLKVEKHILYTCSPANVEKHYKDNLRVEFRFWNGKDNFYVVTAVVLAVIVVAWIDFVCKGNPKGKKPTDTQ